MVGWGDVEQYTLAFPGQKKSTYTLLCVRILMTLSAFAALLIPSSTLALQTHEYEFRSGSVNASWEGFGAIEMRQEATGILLRTGTSTGLILTEEAPNFLADTGLIVATTERPHSLHFAWVFADEPERTFSRELELSSGEAQSAAFLLYRHSMWKEGRKKFGLVLPPGSTVLLHRLELHQSSFVDQLFESVKSFWAFDTYRPYSINLLWGPLAVRTPFETNSLYNSVPPSAYPVMKLLNMMMVGSVILLILSVRYRKLSSKKALQYGGAIVLTLWILLDLRMGGEFLSWVIHDHRSFISPNSTREFRDRDRFYEFADVVSPLVFDRRSYIFLAEEQWPYLGNLRYVTYPAIPGNAFETDDTWVIYRRPDITVSSDGRLLLDGLVISEPGKVLSRFDVGSFVFRTLVPPTPTTAP